MEAPLGAGLFHKAQKVAADDLHRFQHIAAPAFQPEGGGEIRFLPRAQPGGKPHRVAPTCLILRNVVLHAGKKLLAQVELCRQEQLPTGAAVPDNEVDHGGFPGFHKVILHFQPPLHIVKAVGCAVTLQPKGCGHQ